MKIKNNFQTETMWEQLPSVVSKLRKFKTKTPFVFLRPVISIQGLYTLNIFFQFVFELVLGSPGHS